MNEWYLILLIAGLMLIGAEVFVPGGVLGLAGAMALLTAAVLGFSIFSPAVATLAAVGMIVMVGVVIALWIRIFPHTPIGRQMTVLRDLKGAHGNDERFAGLQGKTGVSVTALRPSGIIELDNRRFDVLTAGEMIDQGVAVRVVEVRGNRVLVEAIDESVLE